MAYSLLFADGVRDYLRHKAPLSREGRVRLYAAIDVTLRESGGAYRTDESLRHSPGSPLFWVDCLLVDEQGDGRLHHFRFLANDSAAAAGVLQLVWVDHRSSDRPFGD